MTTKKTSQEQQTTTPFPAMPGFPAMPSFTAMPGFEAGLQAWRAMVDAHNARFEKVLGEMERLESERHERTVSALDDATRLMKSSLDYQRELASEWRKLGLEAAKKGAELAGNV